MCKMVVCFADRTVCIYYHWCLLPCGCQSIMNILKQCIKKFLWVLLWKTGESCHNNSNCLLYDRKHAQSSHNYKHKHDMTTEEKAKY